MPQQPEKAIQPSIAMPTRKAITEMSEPAMNISKIKERSPLVFSTNPNLVERGFENLNHILTRINASHVIFLQATQSSVNYKRKLVFYLNEVIAYLLKVGFADLPQYPFKNSTIVKHTLSKANIKRPSQAALQLEAIRQQAEFIQADVMEFLVSTKRLDYLSQCCICLHAVIGDVEDSIGEQDVGDFPMFVEFPMEIQDMIWKYALPGPSIVEVTVTRKSHSSSRQIQLHVDRPELGLFQACQKSRKLACKKYTTQLAPKLSPRKPSQSKYTRGKPSSRLDLCRTRIDPEQDTIYLKDKPGCDNVFRSWNDWNLNKIQHLAFDHDSSGPYIKNPDWTTLLNMILDFKNLKSLTFIYNDLPRKNNGLLGAWRLVEPNTYSTASDDPYAEQLWEYYLKELNERLDRLRYQGSLQVDHWTTPEIVILKQEIEKYED